MMSKRYRLKDTFGFETRQPLEIATNATALRGRVKLAAQNGQSISEPSKLLPLMLSRFMAKDRALVRSQKLRKEANG
jgi:hypothetical protein